MPSTVLHSLHVLSKDPVITLSLQQSVLPMTVASSTPRAKYRRPRSLRHCPKHCAQACVSDALSWASCIFFFNLRAQFDPDPLNSCSIYYDSGQNICRKKANKKSNRWVVMSVCAFMCACVCVCVCVCVCACMCACMCACECVCVWGWWSWCKCVHAFLHA